MKELKLFMSLVMLMQLFQLIMSSHAFAYIDPGTGSYLFQMLMAGLLGSMFALKMMWRNIRVYFSRFFAQSDSQKHEND
ncbi:hypothetical protein [Candidatus Nitrospira salsa]|nr:MAG: hypothetical protein NPIRA04_36400 [Nitrospirales bacterium]